MRKLTLLAAAPAVAGLLALSFAQGAQVDTQEAPRAQRLAPLGSAPEAQATESAEEAAARWMQSLEADSLDERETAWRSLLDAARRDAGLRGTLSEWAEDASDVDRAWNARLLLRELQGARDPFGALRDPFRGLWGGGDPFADPFGGGMRDMSRLFEDVQRQLDQMLQGGGGQMFGAPPSGGSSQTQQFQLESGPDGVKVRVLEEVDGKQEEQVYEAESLEALLDAYPELRERIQLSPGLGVDARGMLEDLRRRLGGGALGGSWNDLWSDDPGEIATDRLGILMREPGSYSASVEGVEPGVGLLVERVLPHTIASELGLQAGDIVTELNGTKLTSAEDVREALAARARDEPVALKLVDALGQARTVTWEPGEEKPDANGPLRLRRM